MRHPQHTLLEGKRSLERNHCFGNARSGQPHRLRQTGTLFMSAITLFLKPPVSAYEVIYWYTYLHRDPPKVSLI